jgi:hypothetical protein
MQVMIPPSPTDASMRARALARWEGEGGALAPAPQDDAIEHASLRPPGRPRLESARFDPK